MISAYEVKYSSDSGLTWTSATTTASGTSNIVTGLINGTAYVFQVAAINDAGTGLFSTSSSAVTPATTPGAPTSVVGIFANGQSVVSWNAPASTGGSAITSYTVTSTPGSFICATASTSCAVSSLSGGTSYTFTVSATNSVGTGSASSASDAMTPPTTSVIAPGTNSPSSGPSVSNDTSPSIAARGKLSATAIARGLGMTIPSKSKVSVAISKSSKKFCKVSSGKIVGIKTGSCIAVVTVQAPKPKKGKKPAPVRKSVIVKIS